MGAFPNLSRNVPFCPRLSSFVLLGARNGDKSGQKRTNGDKTGHFGTNWETPPFSIYPHLALLKTCFFNREMFFQIPGFGHAGKANLPRTLGRHCPGPCLRTFRLACFLKSTVTAFSSFSDNPDLLFLAFLDFLAFFLSKEFLAFLRVFPSFPRILGVRQR